MSNALTRLANWLQLGKSLLGPMGGRVILLQTDTRLVTVDDLIGMVDALSRGDELAWEFLQRIHDDPRTHSQLRYVIAMALQER